MTIEHDIFRPRKAPARLLYDAFQNEAKHRKGRDVDEWMRLEQEAVHQAACAYATEHGMNTPSLEDVATAERYARGSADYGLTWAVAVAAKITSTPRA